ncbi:MAG: RluA family pseudouridine synthase [Phycisphaeraceae bacterium]|nr:RluA family pseudouridine synthase [Phycisphaeraceae bacterium]
MDYSVEPNDRVTFGLPFADDHLLVVEKPARVPTQPGKGHTHDTLLNGLFARFGRQLQSLGAKRDFGLLHRLDKDTSGLLVVALKPRAYDQLRDDFANRRIRKYYWAVCDGQPKRPSGVIKVPIADDPVSAEDRPGRPRLGRPSRVSGKPAVTAYRLLGQGESACLIEARPVTGRLHQIRIHLDAIGLPILGDQFYGPRRTKSASHRLALHAHRLSFTHPETGEKIDIRTDWPGDLRRLLRDLGLTRPARTFVPTSDREDEIDV